MTFDEWWEENRDTVSTASEKRIAKAAWYSATASERNRCREIATTFVGKYLGSMTVKEIADEIGE